MSYPHLGFNPVPGVPDDVAGMGQKIASAVSSLTEANGLVKRLRDANDSVWVGAAGDAFRSHLNDKLVTDMSHAQTSLETAVNVLSGWHTDLTNFKDVAGRLDQQAAAAQETLKQAKDVYEQAKSDPALKMIGQQFSDSAALQKAQAAINAAESAIGAAGGKVNDAEDALASIMKQAKELAGQCEDVAGKAANALKQATDKLAPHKPGFFSSMFSDIGKALGAVGDWVKNHLDDIHSVLSTIAAIGGLVALVTPPPIDAIALGVSLVAGAGALACDAANPEFRAGITQLCHLNFNKESLGAAMTGVGDLLSVVPGGKMAAEAIRGSDVVVEGASKIANIGNIASKVGDQAGFGAKMIAKLPGVSKLVDNSGLTDLASHALQVAKPTATEAINLGMKAESAGSHLYKDVKEAFA